METAAYTIEILGQKVTVKSGTDPEVVQEALRIAALKTADAQKRLPRSAPYQLALLALLDLAEDYVRSKRRTSDYRKRLDEKTAETLALIEGELKP
ncbi:MAG TPA: cell division protein ZapA [Bdellovibrionota bacterium]|jgi:hypothetical protein|nr:cell division protein ZapA [Bdellovibrionota bacterium]